MAETTGAAGREAGAGDYLARMAASLAAIDPAPVEALIELLGETWAGDNAVFVCGNGGSASTASHMANDLAKQTQLAGRRPLRAQSLTDSIALITAWANDAGFDRVFAEQLRVLARPGDVLICISCSGRSENILAAIAEARSLGVRVVGFSGFGGGAMGALADIHVAVADTDYGVIESAHLVLEHCVAALLRERAVAGRLRAFPAGQPVVLIDRDGVVNRNLDGGVRSWSDFEFLPGSVEALAALSRHGHRVVIVTNQAAVGRGHLTSAQLAEIHRRMTATVEAGGGAIHSVYACEHRPEDACDCRKPAPGLLRRAAQELDFDLREAYFIGDDSSDVAAALAAGAKPVLVLSGRQSGLQSNGPSPEFVVGDLRAAADLIVSRHGTGGVLADAARGAGA